MLNLRSDDGGGGERVLWTAIAATQKRWPKATCMVYTGDLDTSKPMILKRVEVICSKESLFLNSILRLI